MAFSLAIELQLREGSMETVLALFEETLPLVRAEEDCLAFKGHIDAEKPNTLWLYESYTSSDYHRQVHSIRPEIEHLLDNLKPHLAAPWQAWNGEVAFSA